MVVEEERAGLQGQKLVSSLSACSSTVLPSSAKSSTMVGFDERLERVMDELTGHKCDLQILPIVGMGGIGKTTLARNVFYHSYIVHHFDMRIWFTISQEYSSREILVHLLNDGKNQENSETLAELGQRLYKNLFGRKYLIVMDDVWSIDVWGDLKRFFPDNRNGSRILVTTRLFNVVVSLGSQSPYIMEFLDESKSWDLFCEKAFSRQGCPFPELEKIGKYITKCCRGLPLAIVVIGGLLANSMMTREDWEFVAENSLSHQDISKGTSLSSPPFLAINVTFQDIDITAIGSLPNLEVLKLYYNAFEGHEWNSVEGEFLRLRFLLMKNVDVVCWGADKTNFPNLDSLVLEDIISLKEIPSGIGDIETLILFI
ncbi:UNVERIFIED_CONTAM: putative disease resistance protein [Sesamum latifolium]|uniref:Disease resistance protein n=1 Tax=Sesamum latifolium TaxID=2727402 RepID=A0AAW2ULG3_9LAMI